MSHELTVHEDGVAEMAYVGAKPWHGLGQELKPGASLEEWCQAAGMAWEVERAEVRYKASKEVPTRYEVMKGRDVLFRSDNKAPLSVVSDSYQVVQPRKILEHLAELSEQAGFELETAGTLFGGRQFWGLANIGADATVMDPKDKVRGRLLLSTSVDGTLATTGKFVTERVVCANTLGYALEESGRAVRVSHKREFKSTELNKALGIRARDEFAQTMEQFRVLAHTPMTAEQVAHNTISLYLPDQIDELSDKELARVLKRRSIAQICDLSTNNKIMGADMAGCAGTAWGWLNAVTQYVDHDGNARVADRRLQRAWFGRDAVRKQKAFAIAQEHAAGTRTYDRKIDLAQLLEVAD